MIGRSIPNLRHDSFAPKYRVLDSEDHERLDDTPDIAPLFPALTWMMSLAYGGGEWKPRYL